MKQLGERDEQHISSVGSMKQEVIVSNAKTAKAIQDMIDKFENE
jgi:hypothetical protein